MRGLNVFLISYFLITYFLSPAIFAANVSVTGSIQPSPSDVAVTIHSNKPNNAELYEEDDVNLTIDYSSTLKYSTSLVIEATWEKGLIENSGFNYIDVFEYKLGSATISAEGALPTVDIQNRKITWNIPHYSPSEIPRKVHFSLKVRENIPTDQNLTTNVKVGGKISKTTYIGNTLHYSVNPIAPTRISAATPTPKITTSPPTQISLPPTVQSIKFYSINLTSVTDSTATISFQTTIPTSFEIQYGESPQNLSQQIIGLDKQLIREVTLPNLLSQTQYYFKIMTTNKGIKNIHSDIFTFQTASQAQLLNIKKDSSVIQWSHIPISSKESSVIKIPPSKPISITFAVENPEQISGIIAKFQRTKVLGINTFSHSAPIEETRLIEILPGVFSGELLTPSTFGEYRIVLDSKDIYGGFSSKALPYNISIVKPFLVIRENTKEPIENAKVTILRYEASKKSFSNLNQSFNLSYDTNEKGELDIALPVGQYKFEIHAQGYSSKKDTIDLNKDNYPTFYLERTNSLIGKISYYKTTLQEVKEFVMHTLDNFFSSPIGRDASWFFSILITSLFIAAFLIFNHKQHLYKHFLPWFVDILETTILNGLMILMTVLTLGFLISQGSQYLIKFSIPLLITWILWILFIKREWQNQKSSKG
ncbi:MAG TPA: fibronectin type III domain-containing protein [Candidatus Nitrosocosmicus sp.]|nr:fibronectin type III domain-containing protein [Candidatus Nitrosocosmicus sp.]